MTEYSLGLWNMGEGDFHNLLSPKEAKAIIRNAYKNGIHIFDTAYSYNNADSLLYSALKELNAKREDYKIISKVMPVPSMKRKIEASLKRLNLSYFDALLIHWPTDNENLFTSLKSLEELKGKEITKEIGVSNFPLFLLKKVINDFPITIHERPLSLLWSKDWKEEKTLGLKTIAYSPGGMGLLNGKYSKSNPPKDKRASLSSFLSPNFDNLIAEIKAMGEKYGVTPYEIAISWVEMEGVWIITRGQNKPQDLQIKTIALSNEDYIKLTNLSDKINSEALCDNIFNHSWKRKEMEC